MLWFDHSIKNKQKKADFITLTALRATSFFKGIAITDLRPKNYITIAQLKRGRYTTVGNIFLYITGNYVEK